MPDRPPPTFGRKIVEQVRVESQIADEKRHYSPSSEDLGRRKKTLMIGLVTMGTLAAGAVAMTECGRCDPDPNDWNGAQAQQAAKCRSSGGGNSLRHTIRSFRDGIGSSSSTSSSSHSFGSFGGFGAHGGGGG